MEARCTLGEDRTTLTIELGGPQGAVTVTRDAAAVESLIRALIVARAEMLPPRPMVDPVPGTEMQTAAGMRWHVETLRDPLLALVGLLHPGVGWVAIPLEKAQAKELVRSLRRATAPLPG
jgi:hypothetical protein